MRHLQFSKYPNMESGERLASPAPTLSAARTSSPAASSSSSSSSSSPAPHSKSSLAPTPSVLGSTLSTSGRLFGAAGDQPFIGSTLSSAFPLVNHPAFGALYTAGAGRPEFGGLGSLGMSAALATHPQLGALSEWWRAAEAHGRGAAAFLPSFIGFPPFFTPHIQPNHSASPVQIRMPGKNSHSPPKGVNGAVNGSGVCPPTTQSGSFSASPTPVQASTKPTKNSNPSNSHRCSPQSNPAELVEKPIQKPKEKKPRKKPADASVASNSESATSSDSSSDGSLSSDLEDLAEDDEDDDDDDEDDEEEDKQSELSDSEKRTKKKTKVLTPSTGTAKTDRPLCGKPQDKKDTKTHKVSSNPPTLVPLPCSVSPPVLSQTSPLALHGSKSRTEGPQQHFSVIQSTGLAVNSKPLALLTQPRREASPSSSPIALNTSPKALSSTASPKPPKLLPPSSSPQHLPLSLCSSPKPLSVPSPPHSTLPLSTSPKPFGLTSTVTSSKKSSLKPPHHTHSGAAKSNKRKLLEASLAQINEFRLKQTLMSQGQTFPAELKKQGPNKSPKRMSLSSSPLQPTPPPAPQNNHSNLFLSSALLGLPEPHHPNGVIQSTTQDAPLALISKPRKDSASQSRSPQCDSEAGSMPVNLSTGASRTQATAQAGPPSQPPTTSPHATGHGSRKNKSPKGKGQTPGLGQGQGQVDPLTAWKGFSQNHLVQSLVDLFRGGESGIGIPGVGIPGIGIPGVGIPGTCNPTAGLPANKESDDSGDDDDDDDDDDLEEEEEEDEEDSDDSLSESDSNSDSDVSGKKVKDSKLLPSGSSKKETTPRRLTKGPELLNTSTNHTATSCSPLNLQVIKTPTIVTSSSALAYHSSPGSSSYSLASPLGLGKRKRVMDEKELMIPLELGWRRETRIKSVAGRSQGDVAYYGPCGKKLRQYPDVMKGLQWSLLKEDEVIPHILAMEGRRGRPPTSERQLVGEGAKGSRRRKGRPPNVGDPLAPEGPSPSEVKLLRKLEAQEIARQAAQMKLMRKLEKQAMARAAKEARKQQAIMAAEERRKQKEQIKILKQQEKIKRIQQIRMEKEHRAQQILEAKRRKKEEAANAKIMEAEKRIKEKELRRQQAEILKHQELERHRLDMERERRRQHVMLLKAVEARKKAEERERLRQEKRDEKRLNKERKLEQRRLELEIARELKKPNEDMCLSDHKPLPEFCRIPGLILPGRAVSNCLMLMQFLRGFGKVLGLDLNADVPTLGMLQEGLLNVGDSMGQVQDLLVKLLSLAVCDPGLPPGQKTKTMLGDHLTNVGINRDNVSEVLQMYMGAHCGNTELAPLALSLKTKAFQAHTPVQKASILGFLANELACSRAVISEIDKSLDQMSNMRKDKIIMEGKLKKLKTIHAKRTGRREASMGVEENQSVGTPSSAAKRKRKLGGDSDDEDDEDDDSDDQAEEEEDEEEEEMKKVKKVETYDEVKKIVSSTVPLSQVTAVGRFQTLTAFVSSCQDDVDHATSIEELEKQIEKLAKQHHQTRRKLFEISHSLRSMMYGQDRYRRRYWVLPHCGGVFIEAMESGEAPEELEEERQRKRRAVEEVKVKEEPQEIELEKEKPVSLDGQDIQTQGLEPQKEEDIEHGGKKNSPTLFYQQQGCGLKLCTSKDAVAMIELRDLEESQVSVESVRGWCVEEQAMEMDIAVLQQVEELERKVTAASLQAKGWTFPDPQSEREDLVYYEHKPPTKSASANAGDKEHPEDRGEKGGVMRHLDNPLDIAVTRLADLERNIERRYLRSPLGTTIQIRLDNVGTVTVPAPAPSTSADREGGEEEVAHGMKVWRKALSEVRSAAQLAMCIQQLQKSIAWERSIMKVYCQLCKKGDNEDLLLLCDGCDKGCHTYCHKPKITSIPEGDWYCPSCISKASGPSPKNKKPPSKPVASGGAAGKKGGEVKKNAKQTGYGEASEEDSASTSSTPKKGAKDANRKRKTEEASSALPAANQESPVCVKRAKTARDNNRDLGLCRVLLAELERHQDAWPFLTPVNLKSVPGYKKVIKKPMDFSTIREKLVSSQYQNLETFIIDVNLVFENCEKFNEDNSDIGRAGHNMRKFFEKRWTELLKQTN
ncbi:hypothetical protein F2P81_004309 [Scophthalmus maximus]|uniref:Bromodomain adjacent to zinc finger domain protein 2B-like n=1 Tax=Scophthalmus maximus TaxID=52904 RepID=A0A6A4TLU6_SCOMX|nr:hypothetical protein F2P81_004309 [Scophthalmus maximus]